MLGDIFIKTLTGFIALTASLNLFAQSAVEPIFVFSAGYGTCQSLLSRSPAPAEFWGLHEEVSFSLGQDPRLVPSIVSCFRPEGRFHSEIDYTSTVPNPAGSFVEHVSQVVASKVRPVLVVMGHSWGGSLAVETVVQVKHTLNLWSQDPRFFHLRAVPILLVTIDPIDFRFCTPPIFNFLRNFECLKAPTSFSPLSPLYQTATQSVRGWLNVFQTEGLLLHSGPVGKFGQFGHVAADWQLGGFAIAPHQEIARDARTWTAIRDWVFRFVGEPQ